MRLHTYFRSSAAHRVRIVLNLKGIKHERVYVNLRENEHRSPKYLALNPQGLVPVLEVEGHVLSQSLAIIDYLDEMFPEPPLLPKGQMARARVHAISQVCVVDMHPLNNLRVLRYLKDEMGLDQAARDAWSLRWLNEGFDDLEKLLTSDRGTGRFCHGDEPSLADVCLAAQCARARQWLSEGFERWPTVERVHNNCLELRAFQDAMPEAQPDAV